MGKPIYINGFFVSCNEAQNEVVVRACHEYPVESFDEEEIVTTVERDIVAELVMSAEKARSLIELLEEVLDKDIESEEANGEGI